MPADPNARLRITADDETRGAWNAALRTAQKGAGKISGEIKDLFKGAIAGLSIAGLTKLVNEALQYGEAIGQASIKSGLSTEAISELAFAAEGAGLQLSDLSSALGKLQVNTSKAQSGAKNLKESFAELGIRFEKFRLADADRQFEALAEAINRVPEETDKARLATEIFGESGARLLPLFSQGAEGIRKAREEAERLGITLSAEEQEKLQKAGDAMGELKRASAALGRELVITLAPALTETSNFLKDMIPLARSVGSELASLAAEISNVFKKAADSAIGNNISQSLKNSSPILQAATAGFALLKKEAKEAMEAEKEAARKPYLYLPPGGNAVNDLLTKPRKPTDEEFATRQEAVDFLRSQSRPRGERGVSAGFDEATTRYENERKVLEDLDRSIAEQQEQIFKDNSEAISQYLDTIERESLDTLEVQKSVFEELGATIEGSLADAFYNASTGARGFADTVLDSFKRILADRAAAEVVQLFGGLFGGKRDPGAGGGSGTSGALGSLISGALLGGFGGARAAGGPVTSGMGYLVGEKGPEFFMPRQSGTIIPNGVLRGNGAVSISMPVSIDMRGATVDAVKMLEARLPGLLRKTSDDAVARVKDEMKRGKLQRQ